MDTIFRAVSLLMLVTSTGVRGALEGRETDELGDGT